MVGDEPFDIGLLSLYQRCCGFAYLLLNRSYYHPENVTHMDSLGEPITYAVKTVLISDQFEQ